MRWLGLALCVGCDAGQVTIMAPVSFASGPSVVVMEDGVRLTLTQAAWTVADLRLRSPSSTASRLSWPPWIPMAYAHPGHDFAGDVTGELLGTWTLDLLGDDVVLGTATLRPGAFATARLALVADPALVLQGTAEVDGRSVPFAFELAHEASITGVAFDAVVSADAPAALVLGVDLAHALSFIDWHTDPGDDGVLTVADGALENTLIFGVVSAPSWTLNLEDGS